MSEELLKQCPLCRAIRGEVAVRNIYEDDLVLAFLHIAPVNPGHILVVPKEHQGSIAAVSDEGQARVMQVGAKLGRLLAKVVNADGFNLHLANGDCAGQGMPHTHLHVIPRHVTDGFAWTWRTLHVEQDEEQEILDALHKRLEAAK